MTREKAIEIINYHKILVDEDKSGLLDKRLEYEAIDIAIKALKQEQKVGHWIKNKGYDDRDNFFTCSECGRTINIICGETLTDYPYCHCGAKMKDEVN